MRQLNSGSKARCVLLLCLLVSFCRNFMYRLEDLLSARAVMALVLRCDSEVTKDVVSVVYISIL